MTQHGMEYDMRFVGGVFSRNSLIYYISAVFFYSRLTESHPCRRCGTRVL